MSSMQEIIDLTDRICKKMEDAVENELRNMAETQIVLDKYIRDANRMRMELELIKNYHSLQDEVWYVLYTFTISRYAGLRAATR